MPGVAVFLSPQTQTVGDKNGGSRRFERRLGQPLLNLGRLIAHWITSDCCRGSATNSGTEVASETVEDFDGAQRTRTSHSRQWPTGSSKQSRPFKACQH